MTSIWFEGPINEAVQLVNTKNCLFIVFLHDSSDNSDNLSQVILDTSLHDILKNNVIIKLSHESDNAKLFGQLYPIHRVPMIYFIKQGIIKDFAIETTSVQEIKDKIAKLSSITETSSGSSTPNNISNTPLPSSSPSSSFTPTINDDNDNNIPLNAINNDNNNKEAKEKLKKQMELARQKREEKEKQQTKEREIKRRQDGKEAQLTRQQMEEKQNKLYFEKIKKEKKADEEHRRKIKEQIARDRAEKQALLKQKKIQSNNNNDNNDTPSPSREYDECHLNIRQTDGQNLRNKFNANDTLGDVRKWIDENRTDGDQPYKLLAQFPTKHFSVGDEDKTLQQLSLLPSATIIMKWIKNVSNAYQPNGQNNGGMMDYVYSAGGLLYNTVSGVGTTLTGFVGGFFNGIPQTSSNQSHSQYQQSSSSSSLFSNNPPVHGQRLGSGSNNNNHRFNTLRQSEFDDDENDRNKRTYNGNSINQE